MEFVALIGIALCFFAIWFFNRSKYDGPNFNTSIYCKCGNDMCSDNSFISDEGEGEENHVKYKCEKCDLEHDYNFDIAPVPISWTELK